MNYSENTGFKNTSKEQEIKEHLKITKCVLINLINACIDAEDTEHVQDIVNTYLIVSGLMKGIEEEIN